VALQGAFYTLRQRSGGELHVGAIDYGVLTVYLGLLIGIGFYAKHRQENSEDYFVAGRRLGTVTVACL
jgi:Na+/proline symporter